MKKIIILLTTAVALLKFVGEVQATENEWSSRGWTTNAG
jgi:hypothetical protein